MENMKNESRKNVKECNLGLEYPEHKRKKKMPRPSDSVLLSADDLKLRESDLKLDLNVSNATTVTTCNFTQRTAGPVPKNNAKENNNLFVNHVSAELNKIDNLNKIQIGVVSGGHNGSSVGMQVPWFLRKHRRKLSLVLICVFCFLVGIMVPLLLRLCHTKPHRERPHPRSVFPKVELQTYDLDRVLSDLFISVKTTRKYHHPRLVILLETWVSLVKGQTWFFTDAPVKVGESADGDLDLESRLGDKLVYTACGDTHARVALVCKMAAEFDHFVKSMKR